MKNGKRRDVLVIAGILFLLIGLTVGYAALQRTLTINGTTTIADVKWDIHFDNVLVTNGSVANEEGKPVYVTKPAQIVLDEKNRKTKIEYSVTLPLPGTYYDFTADIVNEGSIAGKLESTPVVSGIEGYEDILTYSVTYDDTARTALAVGDTLRPDETKKIRVRIEFKKDITAAQLPENAVDLTLNVQLDYIQV